MKYFRINKNLLIVLAFAVVVFFGANLAHAVDLKTLWSPGDQLVPCDTKSDSSSWVADSGSDSSSWVADSGGSKGCGWADLIILANNIVRFLVFFSAILATMAFCYAGFLYITAFGESGKIEQAHTIFKSTLIGVFFVLCGWLIVATILKVLIGDASNDETGINKIVPFQGVKPIQGQPR